MIEQLFNLTGKRALIVGASSGIGFHCAKVLAQAGAEVVLAARREERLKKHCQQIEELAGVKTRYYTVDVAQPEQVKQFLHQLDTDDQAIDILVNCAGITARETFYEQTIESWQKVVNVNLNGNWQIAYGIAKQMKARNIAGSIINISSTASHRNISSSVTVYGVTKAGINQMTRHMGLVLSKDNIRVNAIAPGWFTTELTRAFFKTEVGKKATSTVPMQRIGNIEELSGALLLLASDAGSYITGTILSVDGGYACNEILV